MIDMYERPMLYGTRKEIEETIKKTTKILCYKKE